MHSKTWYKLAVWLVSPNVCLKYQPQNDFSFTLSTIPVRDERKHSSNTWKIIHSNNATNTINRPAGQSEAFESWWMVSRKFKLEGHLRPIGQHGQNSFQLA